MVELRQRCDHLVGICMIGVGLRQMLAEQGSPTWAPAQDHTWLSWIEEHGDARAHELLEVVYQALLVLLKERRLNAEKREAEARRSSGGD